MGQNTEKQKRGQRAIVSNIVIIGTLSLGKLIIGKGDGGI